MVNNDADRWAAYWAQRNMVNQGPASRGNRSGALVIHPNPIRQFGILVRRYIELQLNDFKTAAIKLLLAPIMAAIVENPDQAITTSTVILIPQILFSSVIVDLSGITNVISLGFFSDVQKIFKYTHIVTQLRVK